MKRPPAAWWDACIAGVRARGGAIEPRAVCGAAWWRLPAARRAAIVSQLEHAKDPRARGAALALARAEKARRPNGRGAPLRKSNPREVVSLVYLEQKPGDDAPYEYEHEFEGKLPELTMRGGKAQIRGGTYFTRGGWLEG